MTIQTPSTGIEPLAEELRTLPDVVVSQDPTALDRASKDEYAMSPVLAHALPATTAEVVAQPLRAGAVASVIAAAVRHRVPITPRGRGTGNYGQAVPLHGGLVLDLSRSAGIRDIGTGWIEAEAGARISALEAAARATGQQLLIYPSTMNSTLGGFLAGGSGGTGSVAHGGIEDGFVKALDVVHAIGDATVHRVDGTACLPYLHAYGTSGVIVAGTVALEPLQDWVGVWASFPRFPDAQAAVVAAAALEPAPRIASADVPELVAAFPAHAGLRLGTASFRAIVDRTILEQLRTLVRELGGTILVEEDGVRAQPPISMLSYNHPSWHVIRRSDKQYFHVEAGGLAMLDRYEDAIAAVPGLLMHLDAGRPEPLGMVTVPYQSDQHVTEVMRILTELGIGVHSPHHWLLDRRIDLVTSTAAATDPLGLLNPGKLPRDSCKFG